MKGVGFKGWYDEHIHAWWMFLWLCDYIWFVSVRNSLESLGETFRVALQWSGRNSMAHVSGCPWWCPICI